MKTKREKALEKEVLSLQDQLDQMTDEAADMYLLASEADVQLAANAMLMAEAASTISDLSAKLQIDNFVLEIAQIILNEKNEVISRLKLAERQRQENEQREARDKANLAAVRNTPSLVDWALVKVNATADSMEFNAEPDRWGRTRITTTDISSDGGNGATVAITKGKAAIKFRLPIFGTFEVAAKVTHTETSSTPDSPFVEIENKLVFKFKMGGKMYRVTITAGGEVRRGCGDWYANTYRSTTKVEYWCDACQEWHYDDDFRTNVNTSPMTERRSGGCGGW